ncbi:Hypothetical predicted protein [Marmota monax]|uniref:Uncharacterized protein n=1 Tax=Marmota monax TaxID=9995 RepID=A0A5E4B8E6_MARMO|nr:hypothetical protein GHT09_004772 [Marmota monax]VTJ65141.1 Hypothetical predicted protein [Marmota monax]
MRINMIDFTSVPKPVSTQMNTSSTEEVRGPRGQRTAVGTVDSFLPQAEDTRTCPGFQEAQPAATRAARLPDALEDLVTLRWD